MEEEEEEIMERRGENEAIGEEIKKERRRRRTFWEERIGRGGEGNIRRKGEHIGKQMSWKKRRKIDKNLKKETDVDSPLGSCPA
ncbi:hypothetical protein JOB18_000895 [Solea senegalensis]|uniref:Uncharacterized protein n=1 Tax=Solea senegalensis TaxID=28829 RepID=A0AAV6PRV4_SOLSE|nr:hypothetical protein JOB18_000895 [Solea senegalensis]